MYVENLKRIYASNIGKKNIDQHQETEGNLNDIDNPSLW